MEDVAHFLLLTQLMCTLQNVSDHVGIVRGHVELRDLLGVDVDLQLVLLDNLHTEQGVRLISCAPNRSLRRHMLLRQARCPSLRDGGCTVVLCAGKVVRCEWGELALCQDRPWLLRPLVFAACATAHRGDS